LGSQPWDSQLKECATCKEVKSGFAGRSVYRSTRASGGAGKAEQEEFRLNRKITLNRDKSICDKQHRAAQNSRGAAGSPLAGKLAAE
jgi:hypothetical protein